MNTKIQKNFKLPHNLLIIGELGWKEGRQEGLLLQKKFLKC